MLYSPLVSSIFSFIEETILLCSLSMLHTKGSGKTAMHANIVLYIGVSGTHMYPGVPQSC